MTERASAKELIHMIDNIQRKLRQMVSELQVYKTVPRQVTDESVYNYMFDLQEAGEVNMLGATPYIKREFGFNEDMASTYLINYIENYDELYNIYRAPIADIQPMEVTIPLPQNVAGPVAALEPAPVAPPTAIPEPVLEVPITPIVHKKRGAKRYDEMTEEEKAAAKAKRVANKANKVVPVVPLPEPPKPKRVIKIKK